MECRWLCMYGLRLKFALRSLCSRRQYSTRTAKPCWFMKCLGDMGRICRGYWSSVMPAGLSWLLLLNSTGRRNSRHFKVWWSGLPGRLSPMSGSSVYLPSGFYYSCLSLLACVPAELLKLGGNARRLTAGISVPPTARLLSHSRLIQVSLPTANKRSGSWLWTAGASVISLGVGAFVSLSLSVSGKVKHLGMVKHWEEQIEWREKTKTNAGWWEVQKVE